MGHVVHLIPSQHVKPFVVGNKNDAIAIAEASHRPRIGFVPVKTIYQSRVASEMTTPIIDLTNF